MTAQELFLGKGWSSPLIAAINGALMGGGLSVIPAMIKNRPAQERLKELSGKNTVDSDEFVAQYAPEVKVMHGPEDIDRKKYGPVNQALLEFYLKRPLPQYMQGQSMISAPKRTNPYAMAHEIGHHEYEKTNKPVSLFSRLSGLSRLLGKETKMEEGAWAASPIEIKDEGLDIKEKGLSTYKTADKYFRIGAGVGAAIGTGISIPYLLKYLKK